jgi:uncharacterized protein YndB with AHSA1/START domain
MSSRFNGSWTININRSVDDVYDYLADPNKHGNFSPRAYHVEDVQGDNGVVGSSFTSVGWVPGDGEHRNKVEVTQGSRPSLLEFASEDRGEKYFNRFALTADGTGTTVTRSADWPRPTGAVGLIFPIIASALIGPDIKKGLGKLKANLEAI